MQSVDLITRDRSHGHPDCRCEGGAKSALSLNQNMETPLASPGIGGSASQESPTGLRGEDAGKSKGRSVMERIGSGNFSAMSRQTSSRS